jgi:hypothetical protein
MAMGPVMLAWPVADIQEPDRIAKPAKVTRAVTAAVQTLFTERSPELSR